MDVVPSTMNGMVFESRNELNGQRVSLLQVMLAQYVDDLECFVYMYITMRAGLLRLV